MVGLGEEGGGLLLLLLLGDRLLHDDHLAPWQRGGLARDEGAVLGADHLQVALGHFRAFFSRLQLPLEPAHARQVGRRHRLLQTRVLA